MNVFLYVTFFTILLNANLLFGVYQYFLWKKIQDDKKVLSRITPTLEKLLDACRTAMDRDEEILAEEMIKDIEEHLKDLE